MNNDPVINIETHLKAYWDLEDDLHKDSIDWRRYEIGIRSINGPTILIHLGDHWYTETIGRTPRVTKFQEIYICPMHKDEPDAIVNAQLWDMTEEIESICKGYKIQATGISFIEFVKDQLPKSWRVDLLWKPFEVDIICRWEIS